VSARNISPQNFGRSSSYSHLLLIGFVSLLCRKLWDAVTGDEICSFEHPHIVRTIDLSEVCVALENARFSCILRFILENFNKPCTHVLVAATSAVVFQDCNYLATGCQDKLIRVFNLQDPKAEPTMLKGHTTNVRVVVFGADSSEIISGAEDPALW
jgi:serine-threonine kinase receptor-associated protein